MQVDKGTYFDQVNYIKNQISQGNAEKVILSRIKRISIPTGFDPVNSFLALMKKHPTAMVYLISTPESGVWLGATPEVLVELAHIVLKY